MALRDEAKHWIHWKVVSSPDIIVFFLYLLFIVLSLFSFLFLFESISFSINFFIILDSRSQIYSFSPFLSLIWSTLANHTDKHSSFDFWKLLLCKVVFSLFLSLHFSFQLLAHRLLGTLCNISYKLPHFFLLLITLFYFVNTLTKVFLKKVSSSFWLAILLVVIRFISKYCHTIFSFRFSSISSLICFFWFPPLYYLITTTTTTRLSLLSIFTQALQLTPFSSLSLTLKQINSPPKHWFTSPSFSFPFNCQYSVQ